ncbi:MAG: hypothetical protein WD845_02100 [Pirellulales bacterium]
MRWRSSSVLLLAIATCVAARADELPYTAYVNSDDVYVRSGPGRNYYPTEKLTKGDAVEVYRHDPGGWLAIRPTPASFAWVSQRHLDPTGDGLATVNTDRVVARVGSTFSEVRDVIQVRLEQGEKVELLAPPEPDSPWCKIAPPAGEFRWVFSKYVDRKLNAELAADDDEATGTEADDVRLVNSQSDVATPRNDDPLQAAGAASSAPLDPASTAARELARLELELSAVVSGDISAWSFGELEKRAENLLQDAQTSTERGHVRILMSKLQRFDEIRQRHDKLRQSTGASATPMPAAGGNGEYRRADISQFDGVGRLSPVISEKVGGPQYALVDNANAVISFVTPAPGVNLRPYVDHYVGVNGQRGYLTDLQRQHISVQRVTVLDVAQR